MRTCSYGVVALVGAGLLTSWGCEGPSKRLNAPPQGASTERSDMQDQYTFMVDNAMLYDMSVADIHFVPHTAKLNSLGARRLNRYSQLLDGIGGTIHLDSALTDEELVEQRRSEIEHFLAAAGLNMEEVTVSTGLPQGRSIDAIEAMRIRQEGTTYDAPSISMEVGR